MPAPFLNLALLLTLCVLQGCATTGAPIEKKDPLPLKKVNIEAIFEENEGLEIREEDCKELRDFYRGGVQNKAKAEQRLQEKAYPEAMTLFNASNDFFERLLQYIPEDDAEYSLFEGTHILFFPNLLMADNYLKMGKTCRIQGNPSAAKRHLEKANTFIEKSLCSEQTEWGFHLHSEIQSLLAAGKK